MSRDGRDDERSGASNDSLEREAPQRTSQDARDVLARDLKLPHDDAREAVQFRGREYLLNGSETRALATVGAFRVISIEDVDVEQDARDVWQGHWRSLSEQGLLTHETLADRDGSRHIVTLTQEGKDLLDAHREVRSDARPQLYYAGVVKPRELAHDSRIYGAFKEEAASIERDGGRVTRVILDYELKRDYQKFLNRADRPDNPDLSQSRSSFAEANDLKVIDGHLELPDLRIEYETEDGRIEHRDVELVTEHYSHGQVAGKARAGFACYTTTGSARGQGGNSRRGGTPFDPRHLERLS